MTALCKSATVVLSVLGVMFLWMALTVPIVAMTGPLLLAVVCGVGAYLTWRKAVKQS